MEVEDSNNYFNLGLDNDTIIQSETINLVEVNTNASKPQAFVRVPDEESKKKKKIHLITDDSKKTMKKPKRNTNQNTNFNTGRWKPDEHKRFIDAILLFGNEWKRVENFVGTRSSTQARSHAQKFFEKMKMANLIDLNIDFESKTSIKTLHNALKSMEKDKYLNTVKVLNNIAFIRKNSKGNGEKRKEIERSTNSDRSFMHDINNSTDHSSKMDYSHIEKPKLMFLTDNLQSELNRNLFNKEKERKREREKEKNKDKEKDKEKEKINEKDKDKEKEREKDKEREKLNRDNNILSNVHFTVNNILNGEKSRKNSIISAAQTSGLTGLNGFASTHNLMNTNQGNLLKKKRMRNLSCNSFDFTSNYHVEFEFDNNTEIEDFGSILFDLFEIDKKLAYNEFADDSSDNEDYLLYEKCYAQQISENSEEDCNNEEEEEDVFSKYVNFSII